MTDTTNHATPTGWAIDTSTGTPILTYEACSVIQDEQAHLVLRALTSLGALTREAEELRLRVDALTGEGKWISSRVHIATMAAKEATIAAQSERIAKLEILLQEALDDQRTDDMPPFDPACCWQCRARIALAALAQKETEPTRHRIEINETETFQTTNIQPKITKEAP